MNDDIFCWFIDVKRRILNFFKTIEGRKIRNIFEKTKISLCPDRDRLYFQTSPNMGKQIAILFFVNDVIVIDGGTNLYIHNISMVKKNINTRKKNDEKFVN
jgi:hypothetical protein